MHEHDDLDGLVLFVDLKEIGKRGVMELEHRGLVAETRPGVWELTALGQEHARLPVAEQDEDVLGFLSALGFEEATEEVGRRLGDWLVAEGLAVKIQEAKEEVIRAEARLDTLLEVNAKGPPEQQVLWEITDRGREEVVARKDEGDAVALELRTNRSKSLRERW